MEKKEEKTSGMRKGAARLPLFAFSVSVVGVAVKMAQ